MIGECLTGDWNATRPELLRQRSLDGYKSENEGGDNYLFHLKQNREKEEDLVETPRQISRLFMTSFRKFGIGKMHKVPLSLKITSFRASVTSKSKFV
jgi:hypothetical protein